MAMTRNSITRVSLEKAIDDSEQVHRANPDADGLEFGDQQRGYIGAGDRSHAAHNHDDEGRADGMQIHFQVSRFARKLQRAAQASQHGPQREHGREQPSLIDAQSADHLAVLGGGAHQRAPAGARQQQPQGA
jgi:hypothetical protein